MQTSLSSARHVKRSLPLPINNEGVDVVFCGLAVTAGRMVDPPGREIRRTLPRDPGREDRLRQIWRSLFTRREAVRFEPYCPTPRDLRPVSYWGGVRKSDEGTLNARERQPRFELWRRIAEARAANEGRAVARRFWSGWKQAERIWANDNASFCVTVSAFQT